MEPDSFMDERTLLGGAGPGGGPGGAASLHLPEGDRYEEIRELGHGGMGRVVLAQDRKLGRQVAIKRILAEDPESRARFLREARVVAALSHRNVVAIFDVGEGDQGLYLVMEYIDGPTLTRLVQEGDSGYLSHPEVLRLGRSMCRGLAAAHRQGVVHRDLKPGNVLIDGDGEPRLLDFGLAKGGFGGQLSLSLSLTGAALGTPDYMAPEQWRSAKEVDHRADLYGIGATLYFAATGRSPRIIEAEGIASDLWRILRPGRRARETLLFRRRVGRGAGAVQRVAVEPGEQGRWRGGGRGHRGGPLPAMRSSQSG